MFSSVSEFRKYDKEYEKNIYKYISKKTYEIFRKSYEKKPICETFEKKLDWKNIYKKINNKKFNSDLRVNNYKILNNGLALDVKVESLRKLCYMCGKEKESNIHIFIECDITKKFFKIIKTISNKKHKNLIINNDLILFHKDLDYETSKLISVFKYAIWKFRNLCKYEESLKAK